MKRSLPLSSFAAVVLLCSSLFTTVANAQTPLPYDAVPVQTGDANLPSPTFSETGNQQPLVSTVQAVTPVLQPAPETIPQSISSGYAPTFSGGAPPFTQPVPTMGAPSGIYNSQGHGRSGLVTGFAFVFLRPHHENNNAFVIRNTTGTTTDTVSEFDWDREVSPRVWVEFIGTDDFGTRFTYWKFDHDPSGRGLTATATNNFLTRDLGTSNGSALSGGVGDTIAASSSLSMYTIDAEFTQRVRLQKWQANIGGGFRHAGVHQSYRARGTVNTNAYTARSSHRFDGIGPTAFAEFRRPIASCGISLIAVVRGSLLYGDSKLRASDSVDTTVGGAGATAGSYRSTNGQAVPVGEIQLGAEWSTWLSHATVLYAQVAWEGQYWSGVGNASSRDDDLGLFGFNTTVGLEW